MLYVSRRRVLCAAPAIAGLALLPATARAAERVPTPACPDNHDLTPAANAADFNYRLGSPRRSSLLEPGMPGERLILTGMVMDTFCRPLTNVVLDFWQADARGDYDFARDRLRGHQVVQNGRYRLETIVPKMYGPVCHIHAKVQAGAGLVLTTWINFPDDADKAEGKLDPLLLPTERRENGLRYASFDFYVKARG